jgi:branched-chain amino acid transport system permease protein
MIPVIVMQAIVFASLISVLSVGWTLTHLTAKIPNFAHGAYAATGVYITYTVFKQMQLSPYWSFPVAFILGGAIGFFLYKTVINILNKMGGGAIVLTIATMAINLFLVAGVNIYATWIRMTTGLYAYDFMVKEGDFLLFGQRGILYASFSVCCSTAILLHLFLTRTRMGIAMRATAEDPGLASIIGINTDRIQQVSWFLTGGMACLAGAMFPFWFLGNTTVGDNLLSACMAGSLLGGVESAYGALIGGFFVGFAQVILTFWLMKGVGEWAGEYRTMIPMVILIFVLLVEPRGIIGLSERFNNSTIGKRFSSRFRRRVKSET